MKKLKLKNLKLDSKDLLQRDQLKSVFGGYGGYGNCTTNCTRTYYNCANGTSTTPQVGIQCTCSWTHSTLYNAFGNVACE